ncbi:helix-turn-helix domain-containing protein [Pyrodictium abyssi]|uniref:HTH iclR-type domain-containing protein n=1 Tax=Pyrodictium abyssi TaxID=54256 RepID=A0ABN6ZL10_9CREN|nr:hypothetical protein PABY_05100 [Pyrodictium abyssi]
MLSLRSRVSRLLDIVSELWRGGEAPVVGENGLDERDEAILRVLAESGRPLRASEIARQLGVHRSVAWRKLKKLVRQGLVEKRIVDGVPLYALPARRRRR